MVTLRQTRTKDVPDMLLVDCFDLRVIEAPTNAEHVALSYVWGRDDPDGSPDPDPLHIHGFGTRTIADAIHSTLGLGKRYLWNDLYCIQ
jgi:hypothetical protein